MLGDRIPLSNLGCSKGQPFLCTFVLIKMTVTASRISELADVVLNEAVDEDDANYLLSLMVLDEELSYDDTSVVQ